MGTARRVGWAAASGRGAAAGADAAGSGRLADLARRLGAEAVGTALLAAAVVGAGEKAARLSLDPGVSLLADSAASALALGVLILLFGPVSGGHLNPVVTLADWRPARRGAGLVSGYLLAQGAGALGGAVLAEAMFGRPLVSFAGAPHGGPGVLLGEVVATAGLVLVVRGLVRSGRGGLAAVVVPAYVGAGIWFTSSGAFANPAVTLARALTGGPTGLAPGSLPGFLAAQLLGTVVGVALAGWFFPVDRPASSASTGAPGRSRCDEEEHLAKISVSYTS